MHLVYNTQQFDLSWAVVNALHLRETQAYFDTKPRYDIRKVLTAIQNRLQAARSPRAWVWTSLLYTYKLRSLFDGWRSCGFKSRLIFNMRRAKRPRGTR